jgi:hypothetical protein
MNQTVSIYPVKTYPAGVGSVVSTPAILRLVLYQGELCRLPQGYTNLHVVAGSGWVSVAGADLILNAEDRIRLPRRGDVALVSALSQSPLILEVQQG